MANFSCAQVGDKALVVQKALYNLTAAQLLVKSLSQLCKSAFVYCYNDLDMAANLAQTSK